MWGGSSAGATSVGMGAFIKSVNEQRRSNSISDMGRGKGRGKGRSKGWTTEGELKAISCSLTVFAL
jgi:hypothetical protein